jgi:hypothetical protein
MILQGVCETSKIGGMGRWLCSDMRLKEVVERWLVARLKDLMMQRRRWWLTTCLGCWVVEWFVWGLTGTLGLHEAEGKSDASGVSGNRLRFVGCVLLHSGAWVDVGLGF